MNAGPSDNSSALQGHPQASGEEAQRQRELSALLMDPQSTPGSPPVFTGTLGFNSVRASPVLGPAATSIAAQSFTNLAALAQSSYRPGLDSATNSAVQSATASPTAGAATASNSTRRNLLAGMARLNMSQLPPVASGAEPVLDHGFATSNGMFGGVPSQLGQPGTTASSDAYLAGMAGGATPTAGTFLGLQRPPPPQTVVTASLSPNAVSAEHIQRVEDTKARGLQIELDGIPSENAKSRVETQIKMTLRVVTKDGQRAQCWSHLMLPELLVSRDKFRHRMQSRQQQAQAQADGSLPLSRHHVLRLEAKIRCMSDPTREVETCRGCINREFKRSLRRKDARLARGAMSTCTTPGQSRPGSPIGDSVGVRGMTGSMESDWDESRIALEKKRIVIFNCNDLQDLSKGEVVLPTRITCYCRHHMEKVGFNIYLTLLDADNNVLAEHVSPPIMITDDHKSTKFKTDRTKTRAKPEYDRHMHHGGGEGNAAYANHALSGMNSPHAGAQFSLLDGNGLLNVKMGMARQDLSVRNSPTLRPHPYQQGYPYAHQHGFLDSYSQFGSLAPTPSLGNTPLGSPMLSAAHMSGFESPFNLPPPHQQPGLALGNYTPQQQQPPPQAGPQQPSSATMASFFGRDAPTQSVLQQMGPLYDGMAAGGSNALGLQPLSPQQQQQQQGLLDDSAVAGFMSQLNSPSLAATVAASSSAAAAAAAAAVAGLEPIQIGQLIPTQGPVAGGVSVMITGRGFHPNVEVFFGDVRAGQVRVESATAITCVLPPAKMSGPVALRIRDHTTLNVAETSDSGFAYVEDTDQALLELALQIVGVGKTAHEREGNGSSSPASGGNRYAEQVESLVRDMAAHDAHVGALLQALLASSSSRNLVEIENVLVKLFAYLVGQGQVDAQVLVQQRHEATGRTLVHFAALLGMCGLLTFIVQQGGGSKGVNVADNSEMSPMHFGAMFGRSDVVELLLNAGASQQLRTCTGQSAADIARAMGHPQVLSLIEARDDCMMSFIREEQLAEPSSVLPASDGMYAAAISGGGYSAMAAPAGPGSAAGGGGVLLGEALFSSQAAAAAHQPQHQYYAPPS
ncbi:SPT3 Dosage dependent suppressor of Ty-induced promoter mutations-like protein [Coemansia sp. RSA 552]|nr:SPT3 Dosage dependent suppressor of Ty-induced promoter mutations-like protein [Coemansia sp. RSA 552]